MNERIRELARESSQYSLLPATKYDEEWANKFAELIIRECLVIVNRKEYSYHEADPLWETAELIKEHFGIEP